MARLGSHHGWCAGDPHIENFGAVLDGQGEAMFTITDMDDAGPCPLAADVLRLLTSVKLTRDEPVGPVLRAYRDGLAGRPREFSGGVTAFLENARRAGRVAKESGVDERRVRFREEIGGDISAEARGLIAKFLARAMPGGHLLDVRETTKNTGGSAGLMRYQTLVRLGGTVEWIEMKELQPPGVLPILRQSQRRAMPAHAERIARTLRLEHQGRASPLYQVVTIQGMSLLLRPKWKGNESVDMSELDAARKAEVFTDEAYVLGRMHRHTAPAAYRSGVDDLPESAWEESAREMADEFRTLFRQL